jgi:hypothetical protein
VSLGLLLQGLAKYRNLDSSHIERLTGWGAFYARRRLRELFDRGFVRKPPKQMRQFGPRDHIYALGPKGISYLKTFASWEKLYLSRAHKATSLPHRVTHGGNMVAFERSCMDMCGVVRFLDTWEILDNVPAFQGKVSWEVDVHWKGDNYRLAVNPDSLAGFLFLKAPEGKNRFHFFVETDLGTENEVRTNWHGPQTSILKTLMKYLATREQGIHTQRFGIQKCKALFIVNDEARIERIIRKRTEIEPRLKHPMFLFATHQAVQKGNVLTIPWVDMSGQKVTIM